MAGKAPVTQLCNGKNMPVLGLGTWLSKAGEVTNAVKVAVENGYRSIDCAFVYGNESEVGAALKNLFDAGTVKREELFITSKLWNTRHSPNDVKPSIQESLDLLGLDYLDLYLIHWPYAFKPGKDNFPKDGDGNVLYADIHYLDTWKALEKCYDEGLVKAIGLSNFNSLQIQDILDNGRVKPASLQVEIHPYFSQKKLVKFCHERDISVTAYSPLGNGTKPWVTADDPVVLEDASLKDLAAKYSKTPAQIILRWLIQRNVCVIPKSVTPSRIQENIDVFDFVLADEDMEVVYALNKDQRFIIPTVKLDGKTVARDRNAPYFPYYEGLEF